MDYFDLLKGSTGPGDSKELTFGDLLSECRESAKEKVEESKEVSEQDYKEDNEELNKDKTPDMGDRSKDPDSDVPPPPDKVKDTDSPMEMRKEYLGKSEETHYYFITIEGGSGSIEDFVIADQDGTKQYSAKEQDMEIAEEGIADFLIAAIRDMDISSIERSIFLKYIYPKLIEEEPEMPLETEEEELPEEPEIEKAPEEAKPPRESVLHELKVDEQQLDLSKLGDDELVAKHDEQRTKNPDSPEVAIMAKEIKKRGLDIGEKEVDEESEVQRIFELKVIDDKENTFDVYLMDNDDEDTAISINGMEHTFSEYSDYFRDEEGKLTEKGLRELALDVLANLSDEEYNELAARAGEEENREGEVGSDVVYAHDSQTEGKDNPGVRDGTGPAKRSAQRSISNKGKRKESGEKCPYEEDNESKENIKGNDDMLDEKKTVIALLHAAEKAEQKANDLRKEADELKKAEKAAEKVAKEKEAKVKAKVAERGGEKSSKAVVVRATGGGWGVWLVGDGKDRSLTVFSKDRKKDAIERAKEEAGEAGVDYRGVEESKSRITETDVSKGTKALIRLAKEAAKESDYARAAEHYTKLAEIEAMVPAEAEAEAEKTPEVPEEEEETELEEEVVVKEQKEISTGKDVNGELLTKGDKVFADDGRVQGKITAIWDDGSVDIEHTSGPGGPLADTFDIKGRSVQKMGSDEEPEEENVDEKKTPPVCKKCGKKHWPFEKCAVAKKGRRMKEGISDEDLLGEFDYLYSEEHFMEQASDEDEKEELTTIYRRLTPRIEQAHRKLAQLVKQGVKNIPTLWWEGSDAWEMAAEGDSTGLVDYLDELINYRAKKESKIKVESIGDINETKQVERLKDLLGMKYGFGFEMY